MKKLYAKASFKSKKPNNNSKNANQDCIDAGTYISKPQHCPIILAYQSGPTQQQQPHSTDMDISSSNGTATMRKRIHKRPTSAFASPPSTVNTPTAVISNEDDSLFPPPPSRTSPSASSSLSASNPSLARHFQPDDAHYYYSIQELQQLNMLDHRHPHFHRQQQQYQLLRQSNSTLTSATSAPPVSYYEHHKLVLQLPLAATSEPTTIATSPIYEAPQIVNNAFDDSGFGGGGGGGGCVGAHSLTYDYNTRSAFVAGGIEEQDLDDDDDFVVTALNGRAAGFGSLPIVDAVTKENSKLLSSSPPASTTSQRSGSLSFKNLRKLQHTHSMPSIRVTNDRSEAGEAAAGLDEEDDTDGEDGYGGLQQLHLYRLQQQLKMRQQQTQSNQHYQPPTTTTRYNSVKANIINNWPTTATNARHVYVKESCVEGNTMDEHQLLRVVCIVCRLL